MNYKNLFPKIAAMTAEVLDLSGVEITPQSNFFGLGGNSTKALQLCVNVEHAFPDLFQEDGMDISQIASQPDMQHFVEALLSPKSSNRVHEGEL